MEQHFDIARYTLKRDLVLERKSLAIDHNYLLIWFDEWSVEGLFHWHAVRSLTIRGKIKFGRYMLRLRIINLDLSAAHVPRMALVRLDTLTAGVRDETCHAKSTLPPWVIYPRDIDKTIINGCKWVHYHASVCIFSIVDHQKCRGDAIVVLSGAEGLVVNGQLIVVFNKAATDSRYVRREGEGC